MVRWGAVRPARHEAPLGRPGGAFFFLDQPPFVDQRRAAVAEAAGAMFKLVIDTSVWLDLAKPENEVSLALLEDVLNVGEASSSCRSWSSTSLPATGAGS